MYARLKSYLQSIANKKVSASSCSGKLSECNGVHSIEPKLFRNIPGPLSLPIIGTLYKYIPLIGEYSFLRLPENGRKKLKRFGPLVREEIVPGVNIVWVFRPEDIAEVFRVETGLHPERRSHLALLKYRRDRAEVYNSGGLLPTHDPYLCISLNLRNGVDWWRLRKEFQKDTSKPQNVINYLEETDRVVREFVQVCENERLEDLLPILSRLYLELTCLVVFDVRIRSFSPEERSENSRSSKLIQAAFTTNSAILKLDNGPQLWRFFETPLYRKLYNAQMYMEKVALEFVSQKKEDRNRFKSTSLLNAYLENPALDIKDIVGMACDMLLAGIDTTTYSTAFALYHLATNQRAQEELRSEATRLLPNSNEPISAEILRNATYTKAVIKESFRMNPISVGVGRILQKDAVLSGYCIPKGTVAVTQNQITCRLPEYFDEPDTFLPERWLRENVGKVVTAKSIHPYLLLPFGHGPRSCIARRFAEQNMQVTLLRLSRQLKFDWHGGQLGTLSLLINKPDAPVRMKFKKHS